MWPFKRKIKETEQERADRLGPVPCGRPLVHYQWTLDDEWKACPACHGQAALAEQERKIQRKAAIYGQAVALALRSQRTCYGEACHDLEDHEHPPCRGCPRRS